jgi:hypothetical protein
LTIDGEEMNTLELSTLLKNNHVTGPYFCGVVPADAIFQQAKACSDRAEKQPFFLIANTDVDGQRGEHWVAFFYLSNGCLEVFDPYGLAPWAYANMCKFFSARQQLKQCTLYNKACVQSPLSNLCGLHCMFVAYKKCENWNVDLKSILLSNYLQDFDYNDCMLLANVPQMFPPLLTSYANVINRLKKSTTCK